MDLSLNEMVNWLHAQGHHAVADSLRHTSEVHSRLFRAQASMIYPAARNDWACMWRCKPVGCVRLGTPRIESGNPG